MYRKKITIRGLNPVTNRANKKDFNAFNEEECRKLALESGLTEPFEIIEVVTLPPSDSQIKYAKELNIQVPIGITNKELSDMISFKIQNGVKADSSLMLYADSLKVEFSEYIGEKDLATRIFAALALEQQISFFLYAVYNSYRGAAITSPHEDPNKDIFRNFAADMCRDEKFVISFKREVLSKLTDSFAILFTPSYVQSFFSSRSYSLEKCEHYLKYKFDVKAPKKTNQPAMAVDVNIPVASSKSKGCAPVLLLIIVSMALLILVDKYNN